MDTSCILAFLAAEVGSAKADELWRDVPSYADAAILAFEESIRREERAKYAYPVSYRSHY
jgi:hypothetical protein